MCDKLLAAYDLLEGGGSGGGGKRSAVPDAGKHNNNNNKEEDDPFKRRIYNVREYKEYPKPRAPDEDEATQQPREIIIRRIAVADAARAEALMGTGYRFVGNLPNGKTVLEKNAG